MGIHPISTVADNSGAKKFKPFTNYHGTKRKNMPGDTVKGSIKLSQACDQKDKKNSVVVKGTVSKAITVRSCLKIKCGAVKIRHFENAVVLISEKGEVIPKTRCTGSVSSLLRKPHVRIEDSDHRHVSSFFDKEY